MGHPSCRRAWPPVMYYRLNLLFTYLQAEWVGHKPLLRVPAARAVPGVWQRKAGYHG